MANADDAAAEPWGAAGATPTEADLLELAAKLNEGDADHTSCEFPRQSLRVDIVVHHRGLDAVAGADVRVTLLWWCEPPTSRVARYDDASTWDEANGYPGLLDDWTEAVNQALNSGVGKTNQTLGHGWQFALGGNDTTQTHTKTLDGQTLDAMHSGVVTFDLDFSSCRRNAVVLLAAVIRAGAVPIALGPADLRELALASPNVAVRSIRLL